MQSADFHRERLERSELVRRRNLASVHSRQYARARAFAYLEEDRDKVWVIVDQDMVVRSERGRTEYQQLEPRDRA